MSGKNVCISTHPPCFDHIFFLGSESSIPNRQVKRYLVQITPLDQSFTNLNGVEPVSLNRWYVIYNHPIGNIYHLYFLLGDYISHTTYYIREPETAIENLPKFTMESLSFYKLLISRHTIYYVLRKRPSCSTVYETEHSFSKCSTLLNYIY